MVRALRADILAATGCTASAGVGPNLLLARLATRQAKPNGQLLVTAAQVRLPMNPTLSHPTLPYKTNFCTVLHTLRHCLCMLLLGCTRGCKALCSQWPGIALLLLGLAAR